MSDPQENPPASDPPGSSRRSFITKLGVGLGAAWASPMILSSPAAAQGSLPDDSCPVPGTVPGYFSWTTAAGYANAQRGGAPGTGAGAAGPMNTALGWTGHPTYVADPVSIPLPSTTGIVVDFRLDDATYLNAGDAGPPSQGHGVAATGTSTATFPSYRISKGGPGLPAPGVPPLNDALDLVVTFSEPVYCVSMDWADVDNSLLAGTPTSFDPMGCTGASATGTVRWADGIAASAAGPGGGSRTAERIAWPGNGGNVLPAVGSTAGPWYASLCASIAQTVGDSNLRLLLYGGPIDTIFVQYLTGFQSTGASGSGNQHTGFGNIQFSYVP